MIAENTVREGCLLSYDVDAGEGELTLDPEFEEESMLMQIDVLQDWINELQFIYNHKRKELFG
jgi:hypothetical protein